MTNKHLVFFLFMLPGSGLMAQHYHYAPNALNISTLKQKGDLEISAGWSRGLSFQALELGSAYSVHRHIALMANYFGAGNKNVRNGEEIGTNFHFWEIGAGAYESFPKGSASLFAGYGYGSLLNHYGPNLDANLDLQRWFIQPGISYKSEHFHAGLAVRLSRINYRKGQVAFSIEPQYLQYIRNIESEAPLLLPEIGLQAGLVIRFITVNFGLAAIFPNTDPYKFARVGTTMSLSANFGTMKKGKTTEKTD
ncbi:MAG: hypothetical protein SFV22_16855 [Saprospiraceae bacterium]|nr:hypothetical protein [Saprospiraceae bacterium]